MIRCFGSGGDDEGRSHLHRPELGSTKLIRGLVTEAATGFQSRRGSTAWPLTVRAQPSRKRVVAVLMPYPENDAEVRARLAATRDELRKLGWSEGENLRVEERWAGDNLARIEADAAELIRLEPDVIFVTGGRV